MFGLEFTIVPVIVETQCMIKKGTNKHRKKGRYQAVPADMKYKKKNHTLLIFLGEDKTM